MKLIFLDIDGTLTSAGSNVPPDSALEAIRAAQAKGNKVYLCTGRNYAMMKPLLKYGFDGYVRHFRSFEDVKECIDKKNPVIACICVNKNDIAEDPQYETDGHVIVILGFDENGDILCADGGFRKEEDGILSYKREEFEKIWFVNGGGIGYFITPSKKEIFP